jgi:hypothetical protein
MLGKANWWFPKSLDRLLPRVSFEKTDVAQTVRPEPAVDELVR